MYSLQYCVGTGTGSLNAASHMLRVRLNKRAAPVVVSCKQR